MQSKENKNAILAVVLSGLILFGWNYLFPTETYETSAPVAKDGEYLNNKEKDKNLQFENNIDNSDTVSGININNSEFTAQKLTLKNSIVSFDIDSFLNVSNIKALNSESELSDIFKKSDLKLLINNSKQKFNLKQIDDEHVDFSSPSGKLKGSIVLNKKNYLDITLLNDVPFIPRLSLSSEAQEMDDGQKQNSYVIYSDSLETVIVGEDDVEKFEGKFKWFGLDFNYHLYSLILNNDLMYKLETRGNELLIEPLDAKSLFNYKVSFLKKNFDDLQGFGFELSKAVDFGIWEIIAVPILRGLQYFYDLLKNYGLAIIILTILIRTLTFPLQYKSFKSMKKMQVIQPELQKIKEKFKDDPQRVQKETMALFKKSGANPIGGCLPMLLQMPVFFAFYKVLFTSVELVDAPFYFWITDLSEKDPFYILPVLMGIAMWLNMKLTPSTTMDPAQQKIMMFMPVMFSLFMLNLPSGLTLYILVSTVVGMLQQIFVYKRTA